MVMVKSMFKTAMILSVFLFITGFFCSSVYAQQSPSYSFVSFDKNYDSLLRSARTNGYQVKEEELDSLFGKHEIFAEKPLDFYTENLYLFFNEKKELIFFTVRYKLDKDSSKTIFDKLVRSIKEKLVEKYGTNENETLPYYRVVGNQYEVVLRPRQATSGFANISFKQLNRFLDYQDYYRQEVEKLENEEILKTVENF